MAIIKTVIVPGYKNGISRIDKSKECKNICTHRDDSGKETYQCKFYGRMGITEYCLDR